MSMLTIHQRFSLQLLFFFSFFIFICILRMSKFAVKKRFFLAALVIFFFFLLAFICILHVEACHTAAFFLTSLVFLTLICIVDVKKRFSLQVLLVLLNICLLDVKAHQKPALFLTSLVNLKIAHFTVQWQAHD